VQGRAAARGDSRSNVTHLRPLRVVQPPPAIVLISIVSFKWARGSSLPYAPTKYTDFFILEMCNTAERRLGGGRPYAAVCATKTNGIDAATKTNGIDAQSNDSHTRETHW